MKFTKIPANTFSKLQLNAGVLLTQFTPATGAYQEADMFGATSGGCNFSVKPTFEDYGADIDNAPKNTLDLMQITDYTITLSGTLLTIDETVAQKLLGAATVDAETGKVTPRKNLSATDFSDIWWVGDYGSDNGFIAIHLMNALSTGGLTLQSSDNGKGKFSFEFTAHFSADAQDTVPCEIYFGEAQ